MRYWIRTAAGPRGQALVEMALVLPILLLLAALALDVGRAFLGSIGVHNLARIGANYSAANPTDLDWGPTSRYQQLMMRDAQAIGCADSVVITDPVFDPDPAVMGGSATVTVECAFDLVTPIAGAILGDFVDVTASATFPVRGLCAGCEEPPVFATPPPAPEDVCNREPALVGFSVGGAKLAWARAGFSGEVSVVDDADDGRTVTASAPTAEADDDGCLPPSTGVLLTTAPIGLPEDCAGGAYAPNLKGMTVPVAESTWTDAGFVATNFATSPESVPPTNIVIVQTMEPDTVALDDCVMDVSSATTTVVTETAPTAMPAYCKVPDLHLLTTDEAEPVWTTSGFSGALETVAGEPTPFVIRYQSLVAHSHELCTVPVTVGPNAVEGA